MTTKYSSFILHPSSFQIDAPPAVVWEILQNPLWLQQAMPDCEKLMHLGEGQYWGVLQVHAGLLQSCFEGKIAISDVQPGVGYSLTAEGFSAEGRLAGNGRIHLTPQDTATLLHVEGEIMVDGALANVGTRYLQTAARALIRQNLTEIARLAAGEETAVPDMSVIEEGGGKRPYLLGFLLTFIGTLWFTRWLYKQWVRHLARQVTVILKEID
ncbi:MAG: hypothetical protein H6662_15045 [Ardenticatenaceae bacterium]|nr:hypothetical protein [Anaerolineales bacterium]MCB8922903.1 hypothetical protein [Ardenticatenaceae bacterium]MCB8990361.1 hypothetical protein [Ardenticatenaceae bacterium]MCB9005254.1 hypothetical protein [Ardenticatenaceae bacterium]